MNMEQIGWLKAVVASYRELRKDVDLFLTDDAAWMVAKRWPELVDEDPTATIEAISESTAALAELEAVEVNRLVAEADFDDACMIPDNGEGDGPAPLADDWK